MAITEFPGPPDLVLPFEQMVLDGRPKTVSPWSVANPHPGYGKDPNILNEYGHTKFPMFADQHTIVQNQEELDAFNAKKNGSVPAAAPAWPSK